jgi:PKD domain/Bacterial Ig-like domain (group 1)
MALVLVSGPAHNVQADPEAGGDPSNAGLQEVVLGSVTPVYRETGLLSLSVDGLGTNNALGGTIQVEKPAGATVRRAFLAAASTGFSQRLLLNGDVKINGANVNWSLTTPSSVTSFNHWADVTSIVKPVVDAAPVGRVNFTLTEVNPPTIDGEILAVVFDDPGQATVNTVALLFGAQSVLGDTFAVGMAEPIDLGNPDFRLDMSLGISFGFQGTSQFSTVRVNGAPLTSAAGGQDDGAAANGALLTVGGLDDSTANPPDPLAGPNNDPRFDDELYNLLPFVHNGDTSVSVFSRNPSMDDNIFFAAFDIKAAVAIVGEGIVLSPLFASNPVGASHTVTARVQDDLGRPVVGRNVTFRVVSGPHAGRTGISPTDQSGEALFTYTGTAVGTDVLEATFVDSQGRLQVSNRVVAEWTSANRPPEVDAGGPYTVNEGGSVTVSATATDPDGDPISYVWDLNNDLTFETPGQSVTFSAAALDGPSSHMIAVRAVDSHGASDIDGATVNVQNVDPTVGPVTSPIDPIAIGTPVAVSAPFTDPGTADTHTAVCAWGDGTTSAGTVTETNGSGTVQCSHAYSVPGTYVVTITVTDDDGGVGSATTTQPVVIFDPQDGFVTGGGWIDSPAGAYYPDPTLTGRVHFGFVAKYRHGQQVPDGNTQFQFQVGNLRFRSDQYEWLVIAGARAQYRGTGQINGAGDYGFTLIAIDGQQNGGGGVDTFRMKIWDLTTNTLIYDNQLNAPESETPTTALGGGSIVIHHP